MKLIYRLYLTTLVFAPLAIGTRALWSRTIMEFLSISGFVLFLIISGKKEKKIYKVPGIIPLMLLLIYMLFHIIPLPGVIIRFLSPEAWDIYSGAAVFAEGSPWYTLSLNIKAGITEFFRFFSYICFYFLTVQLLSDKKRLKQTLLLVATLAGVIAVYALIEKFTSNGMIYWFVEIPPNNQHIGPYVYRNHFAGYMEMLFPVVFALFYYYKPVVRYNTLRESIVELFTLTGTNIHILLGFSALLVVTSVFVSISRGGIISLSFSMMLFTFLMLLKSRVNQNSIRFFMFLMLVVLSVSWFGWDSIFARFEKALLSDVDMFNGRSIFWEDGKAIIRDFTLTGSGFGSFESIYPSYRTFPGNRVVDHAHNDYIELLITSGMLGFTIVSAFMISLFYATFRIFKKRRDEFAIYLTIGTFSGIVALLIHSLSDFNFYNGANGLYFFFLCGLMVAVANTRVRSKKKTCLPVYNIKRLWCISIPVLIILLISLSFNISGLKGLYYFSKIKAVNLSSELTETELREIEVNAAKALKADPWEARYHLSVAALAEFLNDNEKAKANYINAASLNPLHGEILQRFGRFLFRTGEKEKADILYQRGVTSQLMDTERAKYYSAFLLNKDQDDKAISVIRQSISSVLYKEDINDFIKIMAYYGVPPAKMADALPERVSPRYWLADYLFKAGKKDAAEKIELEALTFVKNEKVVHRSFFSRGYSKKIKEKDYEGALAIILDGQTHLPDDFWLHNAAGDCYSKLDIQFRAKQEYRKALTIKPGNKSVQRKLDKLLDISH